MKYTYRDECLLRDKRDIISFKVMRGWICISLLIFLIDPYLIIFKGKEGMGSFRFGLVVTGILLMMTASLYRGMRKRQRKALKLRRRALETGIRCDGRIVDAGMEMETEQCTTEVENGRRETHSISVPNYWIDVEYIGPGADRVGRYRAIHFSKDMKRFIGRSVDVYVWKEWSKYLNEDLLRVYIDTGGLV